MAPKKFIWLPGLENRYDRRARSHVLQQHLARKRSLNAKKCNLKESTNTEPAENDAIHPNVIHSKDVLETVAVDLGKRERFLVHHFVTYQITSVFRLDVVNAYFNPPSCISFPLWAHDRTALLAMATCAAYETSVLLCGRVNEEAVRTETRAVKLLYDRVGLNDLQNIKLSMLLIVSLISRDVESAPKEVTSYREKILRHHIAGMRKLIQRFGGIELLVRDLQVGWTVHWYDLLAGGEISIGLSPYTKFIVIGHNFWNPALEVIPLPPLQEQSDHQETLLSAAASEMLGLYSSLYLIFGKRDTAKFDQTLASVRLETEKNNAKASLILNGVKMLFDNHPLLFQAIRDREGNSNPKFARLATLTYLAAKAVHLFEEEDDVTVTRYFATLKKFMNAQNLEQTPFLWSLVMVLMTQYDTFSIEDPQMLWLTLRILWLSKALTVQVAMEIEQSFFTLLFNNPRNLQVGYGYPDPQPPSVFAERLLPLLMPSVWNFENTQC